MSSVDPPSPPLPHPALSQASSKAFGAPRALVLRAPGTNCDHETAHAFTLAGAIAERVHINRLIENPAIAARYQILCLPGGFSYGDDIAAGQILATRMRHHLSATIDPFVHGGRDCLVLGICNGMQVLMRLGVLTEDRQLDRSLEPEPPTAVATLTWNDHGRFESRWVHLAVDQSPCVFLRGIQRMYLPMAHAEGKFVTSSPSVLARLKSEGRLALRYCDPDETMTGIREDRLPFPLNPNGAEGNVAGVCDASGKVFGLMPHPERHLEATQHPYWTRRDEQPQHGEGLAIFKNAVEYFA